MTMPIQLPKGEGACVLTGSVKNVTPSGNTNHTQLVRKLSLQRGWGACPVVHGVWATEWGPEPGPMGSNPGDISPDHRQNGRGTGLALQRESLYVHHTGNCLYPALMANLFCEATNSMSPQSWSGASLQKRREIQQRNEKRDQRKSKYGRGRWAIADDRILPVERTWAVRNRFCVQTGRGFPSVCWKHSLQPLSSHPSDRALRLQIRLLWMDYL